METVTLLAVMFLAGSLVAVWAFLTLRREFLQRRTLIAFQGPMWRVDGTRTDGRPVWAVGMDRAHATAIFRDLGGDESTATWTEVERWEIER